MLDTRSQDGDLTGALIADLVLQILAYVAQKEREFIRERQAEGIAAAKAKGVRFGRKPKELPEGFGVVCKKCCSGVFSIAAAARALNMSKTTFYYKYRDYLGTL